MAIPNSAGSVALTTTPAIIFDAESCGGVVGGIWLQNDSASAGLVLINIPGLHKTAEFVPLSKAVVSGLAFRIKKGSITTVTVKSDTTATVNWGVIEK